MLLYIDLSASQVATWRDCPRKWAYNKIDKIPSAPNRYAERGTTVHAQLEHYVRTGVFDTSHEYAKIIAPAIQYIPRLDSRLQPEIEFSFIDSVFNFRGRIDLHNVDNDGTPHCYDYKTTSDLVWAKSESDLRIDTQSIVYAKYCLEKYETEKTRNTWIYIQANKSKPKARAVTIELTAQDVAEPWNKILQDAQEMKAVRDSGRSAKDVTPNVLACDMYGGCSYKNICEISHKERIKSVMAQISLKDRVFQKAKPNGGTEQTVPVNRPPKVVVESTAKGETTTKTRTETAKTETKTATSANSYTLYVDCMPVKGAKLNVATFGSFAAPVLDALQEEHGTHYRLLENTYGAAPAMLSDALDKYLSKNVVPVHGVHVTMASTEVRDCYEVLCKHASVVVRGF